MTAMPPRIEKINERPIQQSKASRFVEKRVFPTVFAVATIVLAAELFDVWPFHRSSGDIACDDVADKVAAHQVVAMGVQ